MIGSGLKKLARENGMQIAHGVAYGGFRGYAVTLSEGAGYKSMAIATHFSVAGQENALREQVGQRNVQREFRVQSLVITPGSIQVVFADTIGTIKKMLAFADWFFPLLSQYSATGVQCCTECGGDLSGSGHWKLIDGVACHLHEGCAQSVQRSISQDMEQRRQEDNGSYISGLAGALIGAALGAVLWALVLQVGIVASLVGLLIGWLALKGYTMLNGKQGKGKVVILIVAVIFGVCLGTFGGEAIALAKMIADGELPGYGYGDILQLIRFLLETSSEYVGVIVRNIGLGLLFAFLGAFSLLRQTGKELSNTKVIDLE